VLRTGVDLIEVARLEAAVTRHGQRFLDRVFTPQEQADSGGRAQSLAARFAAKEAVAKALGSGIGVISWRDIEITRETGQRPQLVLHGAAQALAAELGLREWSVSLSHTRDYAIAVATAMAVDRA
jgi:holo-[acyl-carrier protein] synthase